MKNKAYILIFTLILIGVDAFSQASDIDFAKQEDALKTFIGNSNTKVLQSKYSIELAKLYRSKNFFNKAQKSYRKSIQLIDPRKSADIFAISNMGIGQVFMNTKLFKLDSALFYYSQIEKYYNLLSDSVKLEFHKQLTSMNYALYSFDVAIEHCLQCVELAKRISNNKTLRFCYSRLAIFNQMYIGDDEKTKTYSALALNSAIADQDTGAISYYYMIYANNLNEMGYFEKGLQYLDSCERYEDLRNSHRLIIDLYMSKGVAHVGLGHHGIAEKYYLAAENLTDSLKVLNRQMHIPLDMADLELDRKNYKQAIKYASKALTIHPEKLTLYELEKANKQLYEAHEALEQYEEAYYHMQSWNMYQDSMQKMNNVGVIAGLESKYRHDEQKGIIAFQEKEIVHQRKRRNMILWSLLMMSLLSVGLFLLFIRVKYAGKRIIKQNAKIVEQSDDLRQNDSMKSRFYTNISHELRTPLSLIVGPIGSILKSKGLTERNTLLLEKAQTGSKDLVKLINSIFDLAKLNAGEMKLEEQPVNLNDVVKNILQEFAARAKYSNVTLLYNNKVNRHQIFNLDKNKLEIVLRNLMSNALKFINHEGNIKVMVEETTHHLLIQIKDTGKGIHQDDIQHIFDRYFQTKNSDAPTEGGTGIGLAIVHDFIKLMKGNISVKSDLNKGTIFYLELPKNEVIEAQLKEIDVVSEPHRVRIKEQNEIPLNPEKNTILIVEDNDSLRSYLQTILEPSYNILTAENGQLALDIVQKMMTSDDGSKLDLVLSDIMMPVMDGYELLSNIKSRKSTMHLPVIMLTAKVEKSDKMKALRIGVDDYIMKPFVEDELLLRIAHILDNYNSRMIIGEGQDEISQSRPEFSQEDQEWLKECEEILNQNIENSNFKVSQLAFDLAMSDSTLARQLKRLTGLTASKYMQELRLNTARDTLEQRKFNTVSRVAYSVGYIDAKAFSKIFKKRFGKSPSSYL